MLKTNLSLCKSFIIAMNSIPKNHSVYCYCEKERKNDFIVFIRIKQEGFFAFQIIQNGGRQEII
jgi:hypothetical protein